MSALQDQFDMGRIPIRPLAYENKAKAFTQELMIDCVRSNEGETPTFHLYITDPTDPRKVYDLSAMIAESAINGKGVTISIDGMAEPMTLDQVLTYIYKRFVHIHNPTGYVPETDLQDVLNRNNKNVILKDVNNQAVFPITRAEAVIDDNGNTLQQRLNSITRIGFANDYLQVSSDGQNTFEITYPFPDYLAGGNFMQLMIGTTVIDKSRYRIDEYEPDSNGEVQGCSVTFYTDTFEQGRRIDILYIYNSNNVDGNHFTPIDGYAIALHTIQANKLEKVSSSYSLNSTDTLATSKAVRDLHELIWDNMSQNSAKAAYARDLSPDIRDTITANVANEGIIIGAGNTMLSVVTSGTKSRIINLSLTSMDNEINRNSITKTYANISVPYEIPANSVVKFLVNENTATVLMTERVHLANTRYIHHSAGNENEISYANMDVIEGGILKIYRSGVRLFKDVDYSMLPNKKIKLFVKTNANEKIIFECEYITY